MIAAFGLLDVHQRPCGEQWIQFHKVEKLIKRTFAPFASTNCWWINECTHDKDCKGSETGQSNDELKKYTLKKTTAFKLYVFMVFFCEMFTYLFAL